MLGEFNRVFNVDAGKGLPGGGEETIEGNLAVDDVLRRNSRQYFDTAADQILGLVGRSLNGMFLFILRRRKRFYRLTLLKGKSSQASCFDASLISFSDNYQPS